MAKDKLTEYDATAANNTVVGDVNLAENSCLPSDLNNAVREVMSHLKGFASGTDAIDALTVTGAATVNGAFTSPGIDDNADATAITIDSSENVLVGTTSNNSANAGHGFQSDGFVYHTRDGGSMLRLNRLTSDGEILNIRKDGTTVGSIGTLSGYLTVGDDVGLLFNNANPSISAFNAATNANRDAEIDVGASNARFRNMYLSGQVFANVIGRVDDTNTTIDFPGSDVIQFFTAGTEQARVENNAFLIFKTATDKTVSGIAFENHGSNNVSCHMTAANDPILILNRQSADGTLVQFRHADTTEGSISVLGSTVSYNGGHLARWSQATDGNRIDGLVKGTVMTNLDQMAEWTKDGVTEDNEQLNCMAVSSVEGDANVAGVFVNWDDDDDYYTADMNVAMTGDMVIRIASGTTVARGDLLMSAGDGTAKPQDDDIVRSKTIAKVTSTNKSHTYDDGSYLVPCVLMAC